MRTRTSALWARRAFALVALAIASAIAHCCLPALAQEREQSFSGATVIPEKTNLADNRSALSWKRETGVRPDPLESPSGQTAGAVSSVADLLFGAAAPLSRAQGSSNALLPFLEPTILSLYAASPGRRGSDLVERLRGISRDVYSNEKLRDCHYSLYTALRDTFGWVRDNVPLRIQQVEGQPLADAAWPDQQLVPDLELTAALMDALADEARLGEVAAHLSAACGLHPTDFAALVPRIAWVLAGLHADLPTLQGLASQIHRSQWQSGEKLATPELGRGTLHGRHAVRSTLRPLSTLSQGDTRTKLPAYDCDSKTERCRRERLLLSSDFKYVYEDPPSGFVPKDPESLPQVYIPLVINVLLYRDGVRGFGPANWQQSPESVRRAVRLVNAMAKPTGFQFWVKELRYDPSVHPNLVLPSSTTWQRASHDNCTGLYCLTSAALVNTLVVDFPRSINVFVASDIIAMNGTSGYSSIPGSDNDPMRGFVFLTWDQLSIDGFNNALAYYDGPQTLLHELFHFLGVAHPFGFTNDEKNSCDDDDYITDTPVTHGSVSSSQFYALAKEYCLNLFWRKYGGDWEATLARWSSGLGVPEDDVNAWADSCPNKPGYDELGNYMTYNTAVCFAALGHFTAEQALWAHYATSMLNPVLYTWGQYYASNPPAAAPQPPAVLDSQAAIYNESCRVAYGDQECLCKSTWSFGADNTYNITFKYCQMLPWIITGNSRLYCEVQDPSRCRQCSDLKPGEACVAPCLGSFQQCGVPPAPGAGKPPPPRPPPTPPAPPPRPPPGDYPNECKWAEGNCPCREYWSYPDVPGVHRYCANPDNDSKGLWCMAEPSCSASNVTAAYVYCSSDLTLEYCGTAGRPPPAPPSPPGTRRPPSPPPPKASGAPVTNLTGTVVLSACGKSGLGSLLLLELTRELARVYGVSATNVQVFGPSINCGSVVNGQSVNYVLLSYWVVLPPETSPSQAAAVVASGQSLSKALSKTFTDRWGGVQGSSITEPAGLPQQCAGGGCGPNIGSTSPGDGGGKRALNGFLVALIALATAATMRSGMLL